MYDKSMKMGKIVVVDDERIVTSAFKTLLKVEGFVRAHFFNNPLEALEFLKSNVPDLVISDFLMPEMNGLEFLNEVKGLNPDLIVVVAYGKILPKELLDIPKYGCINVYG